VTLLLWIVRLLVLLLIVRFVVTMVRQVMVRTGTAPRPPKAPGRQAERIGGTLVQDPQCGTYLPKERAIAVAAGGDTQYFCSDTCREQWARRAS